MRAIVLERPTQFKVAEVPDAPAPQAGEALVRVQRVGICGSDYSGYLGQMPFYSYPRIPGHELGVEVLAVGEGVTNVKRGDRCAVEPYLNCQRCLACRRGGSNCCENLQVLGVHTDGGLRPRLVLPARKLHPSAKLAPEQLALVETLAIGCHAVNRGNPQAGDNVVVIGAGPIGLSVLQFVKLAGARVIVVDLSEQRLEFCRRSMGVEHTVVAKGLGPTLEAVRELTHGELGAVVFDATGNHQCMSEAINLVAFTGRLVFVGITTRELSFEHPLMHRRELTLLASRNALPGDFTRLIQIIEAGQIDTRPWITHEAGFTEMIAEFPNWLKPASGVIKAVVRVE
jgi:alcohol dehydrogenase